MFTYHTCNLSETHSDPAVGYALKVYVQEVRVTSICVNSNKNITGRHFAVGWCPKGETIILGIFSLVTRKLLKLIHVVVHVPENHCYLTYRLVELSVTRRKSCNWNLNEIFIIDSYWSAYPIQRCLLIDVESGKVMHHCESAAGMYSGGEYMSNTGCDH